MSNTQTAFSDSQFWSLQDRYSGFALQCVKTHLQNAGHRGIAFHYGLLSMGLLLKTFQKTPMLQEIITVFVGAYTFNRNTAPSKALQAARGLNMEGLCKLAKLQVDTNLENINGEAYGYWLDTLQRLERQGHTVAPDARRDRSMTKFLVKYHTLRSLVKRFEPDFTMDKIRLEAENSRGSEQGEREDEAVEAIGRRLYPDLFNYEQQGKATRQMGKATDQMGKGAGHADFDLTAVGLEKLEWLGSQKELAELFIELERKGWVREKKARTIQAFFTKSDTIDQILKPNRDFKYPEVFTPNYKPRFDSVKPNRPKPSAKGKR